MAACILIPAYNAASTVEAVAREALSTGLPVLVVDDGSLDGTAAKLSGLPLTLIVLPENRGKGGALKAGFARALADGFQAVVTADADGQHDLSAIPLLIERARATASDVLIASRYAQFRGMAGLRRSWNNFGAWCFRKRTGLDLDDSQSGFRCYSARFLSEVRLTTDGYQMEMEALLKAWRGGYLIDSLPAAARVADGRATSHYRAVRDTWNVCMTFLRHM